MSRHVAVQDVAFIVSAFKAAMLCHVMLRSRMLSLWLPFKTVKPWLPKLLETLDGC